MRPDPSALYRGFCLLPVSSDSGTEGSARHRAEEIICKCAHPHFRPLLKGYLKLAGGGDEPNVGDVVTLAGWWKDYDDACRSFPD